MVRLAEVIMSRTEPTLYNAHEINLASQAEVERLTKENDELNDMIIEVTDAAMQIGSTANRAVIEAQPAEKRLREIITENPYFGDWDEWAALAYDKIPVLPRMVLSHVYGRHDDSELPYAYCVLCTLFRNDARAADEVERLESVPSSPAGAGLPGEQETQR